MSNSSFHPLNEKLVVLFNARPFICLSNEVLDNFISHFLYPFSQILSFVRHHLEYMDGTIASFPGSRAGARAWERGYCNRYEFDNPCSEQVGFS